MSNNIIEISTSSLLKTREVCIDGHVYDVRPLGAGDRLDISRYSNLILAKGRELTNSKSKLAALKELEKQGDEEKITKALRSVEATVSEIVEYQEAISNCYAKLFNDREDGTKAKALIAKIGAEKVPELLEQIFGKETNG